MTDSFNIHKTGRDTNVHVSQGQINRILAKAAIVDTSQDYQNIQNLPYDKLRKGIPRDPFANLSQALVHLSPSLAQRLSDLPSEGITIRPTSKVDIARYTSVNPRILEEEDHEMADGTKDKDVNAALQAIELSLGEPSAPLQVAIEVQATEQDVGLADANYQATLALLSNDAKAMSNIAKVIERQMGEGETQDEESEAESLDAATATMIAMGNQLNKLQKERDLELALMSQAMSIHGRDESGSDGNTDDRSIHIANGGASTSQPASGGTPKRALHMPTVPNVLLPTNYEIACNRFNNPELIAKFTVDGLTPMQIIDRFYNLAVGVYKLLVSESFDVWDKVEVAMEMDQLNGLRIKCLEMIETACEKYNSEDPAPAYSRDMLADLLTYVATSEGAEYGLPTFKTTEGKNAYYGGLIFRHYYSTMRKDLKLTRERYSDLFEDFIQKSDKMLTDIRNEMMNISSSIEDVKDTTQTLADQVSTLRLEMKDLKKTTSNLSVQVTNLTHAITQTNFNRAAPGLNTDFNLKPSSGVVIDSGSKKPPLLSYKPGPLLNQVKHAIWQDMDAFNGKPSTDREAKYMSKFNYDAALKAIIQPNLPVCNGELTESMCFAILLACTPMTKKAAQLTHVLLSDIIEKAEEPLSNIFNTVISYIESESALTATKKVTTQTYQSPAATTSSDSLAAWRELFG